MKTIKISFETKFLGVLGFIVLSSLFSCAQKTVTGDCPIKYDSEVQLELSTHTLSPLSAYGERALFNQNVSSTTTITIDTLVDRIPYEQFCFLKKKADMLSISTCTSGFITGIKMSYGLTPDKKSVSLVYQPIKLCKYSENIVTESSSSYTVVTFFVTSVGAKYLYNKSAEVFSLTTQPIADAHTGRYLTDILIVHNYGQNRLPFKDPIPDNDTTGDVNSVIFSFQEIERLMYDNNFPSHVKIWNSLKQYTFETTGIQRKHGIFLGPGNINKKGGEREEDKNTVFVNSYSFDGKYANRTHLCPPACFTLSYRKASAKKK